MTTSYVVRRVRAGEWQAARDLRLEALRDPVAHLAFLTQLDDALARSDDDWRERTEAASAGPSVAQFVASTEEGELLGTATALCSATVGAPTGRQDGRADIVAVYVRAECRGGGVLQRLLEGIETWLRRAGIGQARLHVHEENHRARAAYFKSGYVETGVRREVRNGQELEMVRDLQVEGDVR